jgi:hypothetical protein
MHWQSSSSSKAQSPEFKLQYRKKNKIENKKNLKDYNNIRNVHSRKMAES